MTLIGLVLWVVFADCDLGRHGRHIPVSTSECIIIYGVIGIVVLAAIVGGVIRTFFPNLMSVDMFKAWRKRH
jgi:hypothetical protein